MWIYVCVYVCLCVCVCLCLCVLLVFSFAWKGNVRAPVVGDLVKWNGLQSNDKIQLDQSSPCKLLHWFVDGEGNLACVLSQNHGRSHARWSLLTKANVTDITLHNTCPQKPQVYKGPTKDQAEEYAKGL